ncbi:hypothetical protein Taro_027339 [Colocasia esculenta]|uniref:Uncharacterized protein n=1 Tax=Colocasia esculenta TaxID=4460 RepID=A0A843VJU4_COLES|nr:hypothetical protein [Colocasia esculenta]
MPKKGGGGRARRAASGVASRHVPVCEEAGRDIGFCRPQKRGLHVSLSSSLALASFFLLSPGYSLPPCRYLEGNFRGDEIKERGRLVSFWRYSLFSVLAVFPSEGDIRGGEEGRGAVKGGNLEIVSGGSDGEATRMYGDFHLMPSTSPSIMLMGGGGGGGNVGGGSSISGGVDGATGPVGDNNMMLIQAGASSSTAALVDPFFSTPIRNPSHSLSSFMTGLPHFHGFSNIMPKEEAELMMGMGLSQVDGEMELSGSASGQLDGGSGEDHDDELLFATPPQNQQGAQQAQNQAQSSQQQNDQQQNGDGQPKKKRYHRHTPHQIQEMETSARTRMTSRGSS